MSQDYQPVSIKQYPRLAARETADERYWSKLKFPTTSKELGSVTSIHFSPKAPYDYAVTAGTKITIYDARTNTPKRSFTKFKKTATSGHFRSDGKLLVAGDHGGLVQVFDTKGKAVLRRFEGHTRAVHFTRFSETNNFILSGGDDMVVKAWDVSVEREVHNFSGHEDYVRSGCVHPSAPLFASGSYDRNAKLWDHRTNECTITFNHEGPIESVAFFRSGTALVTAGENYVKVWDIVAGKLLSTISNHQKTITDVCFDSTGQRMFTCGLDRLIKVYDVSKWTTLHSFTYSNPILAMGVAPDDNCIVSGMTNGLLDVRCREDPSSKHSFASKGHLGPPRPGTFKYRIRGLDHRPSTHDYRVNVVRKKRLKLHDKLMKKFQYAEALDATFQRGCRPAVIVSILLELQEQEVLKRALSGRDEVTLEPILRFCTKYIANPRFSRVVCVVAEYLLDIYVPGVLGSSVIDDLYRRLANKLKAELQFQRSLQKFIGQMDLLLATHEA